MSELFQIVLEVAGDALVQVDAGMTAHVMLLAGVGVEVGLRAGLYAGVKEREAVLGHNRLVVVSSDDLQTAFQVLGLADEAALGIAIGIVLRRAHVALAVHHLIPLPVDDGSSCDAYLEDVWVVGHQRDGHEASVAPSVDAEAVAIDVG